MLEHGKGTEEDVERFRAADYANSDAPEGYQTAWGWLAKNEPEAFEFLQSPGADLKPYEDRASAVAREEHIDSLDLLAPPAVCVTGGPHIVKAFPNILYRYIFAS